MSEIITAIYEKGVLRPVNPLSLNEGQIVRLRIETENEAKDTKTELEKLLDKLAAAGILRQPSKPNQLDSNELARREQAWREKVKKMLPLEGKPLSETIIEDRGAW